MANTFKIVPISVNINTATPGQWTAYDGRFNPGGAYSNANADIIQAINNPLGTYTYVVVFQTIPPVAPYLMLPGVAEISFDMDTTNIILTGDFNGIYTFAGLPAGFTALTAIMFVKGSSACPGVGAYVHATKNGIVIAGDPHYAGIDLTGESMLNLVSNNYGVQLANPGGNYSAVLWAGCLSCSTYPPAVYDTVYVSGTYTTTSLTWTLQNNSPVQQGDPITVVASGGSPLDPTQITTVTASFDDENGVPRTVNIPSIDWTNVTATLFVFLLQLGGYQPQTVAISITSTQFSGSVTLGVLSTIYFRNAPGIYRIVSGKTSDTLYDVSDPGTTVDVKIPNPFAKTAFVP